MAEGWEMGDSMSSSSDGERPSERRRRSTRLSADRGVIKRETWVSSESGSETEMEVSAGDESDVPLAQRDERYSTTDSSDDDGTDDENPVVKRELGQEMEEDGMVRIKEEVPVREAEGESDSSEASSASDEDDDGSSDGSSDDDDDSDGASTVQSEKSAHSELERNGVADNASLSSEAVGQNADEVKSEADEESADDVKSDTASEQVHGPHPQIVSEKDDTLVGLDSENEDTAATEPIEDTEMNENEESGPRGDDNEDEEDAEEDLAVNGDDEDEEVEFDDKRTSQRSTLAEARYLMVQLARAHLPMAERSVLAHGRRVSGPPIDLPLSQVEQWKRKYRWPVALRNVRRRKFSANAHEIAADYEVELTEPLRGDSASLATARRAFAAALAPTARPLMETAVSTFREESRRSCQGAEADEEETKGDDPGGLDGACLRTLTRLGGHFTDQLLDSILVKNILALQGIDGSYAQQCWDPLPFSKRPVGNWRFVLEHFCRTSTHGVDASAIAFAPRLRKDTLVRIRDRLRTLYGAAWRPEDDEFFALAERQEMDPPDPRDIIQF